MSLKEQDYFTYIDINPQNYKSKQELITDLEEISKTLENITNDWKEREAFLKKISSICLGNQGKSDLFLKYFNSKLSTSLEIQLSDLRSSVMKEACRVTSLCARELGLLIEQGITQLFTQTCLFKIAGSANKVISESSSKCILNIVRYVNSIKIISSICEIRVMKSKSVRILCSQCLVNIICYYENSYLIKTKDIIEETIKNLLTDANAEVRATTRKAFILYKSRYEKDAENLFSELGKNVQKQINEDEKNFGNDFKIKIENEEDDKLLDEVGKQIDDNLNNINYKELVQIKPKTPEFKLFKKKTSKEYNNNSKHTKSSKKYTKNYKNYIGEKKEETVKYINEDDDEIVENNEGLIKFNDDEEGKNKGPEDNKRNKVNENKNEDSNELNAVFNYSNKQVKKKSNKTNKIGFSKKQNKKSEDSNIKLNDKNSINNLNDSPRDSIKGKENKNQEILSDSNNKNNINNISTRKNDNDPKKVNADENLETNKVNSDNSKNIIMINNSSRIINTTPNSIGNSSNFESSQNNNNMGNPKTKAKHKNDLNPKTNEKNKNHILKNSNSKLEKLEANEVSGSSHNIINKNNYITGVKRGKSGEKVKLSNNEFKKIKNIKSINTKKDSKNNWNENEDEIKRENIEKNGDKTPENNTNNVNKKENDDVHKKKLLSKQIFKKVETVQLDIADDIAKKEEDDENEEDILDKAIDQDKFRDKAKTNHKKDNNNINNINLDNKEKNNLKTNIYRFNKSNNKKDSKKNNLLQSTNNSNIDSLINNTLNNNNNNNDIQSDKKLPESIEDKIITIIDKLDTLINQNEKLLLFQYLFNYFNSTLQEINNFSQNTIKRYIDIHIENLKEIDNKALVEQVIKNLMRMIFYMNKIFNTYEIESILKILLFSIQEINDKTINKLSNQLLEIMKKKCDNEELFKSVYSLLGEYNSNYDNCYEFIYLLMPECDKILNNNNYFKQVFRLICLTDINSKKVGKIIDILYRKYANNFNQAYDEETPENKKQILGFMEKSNSLYYREFKSLHEDNNANNEQKNKINEKKEQINNKISQNKIDNNVKIENVNKDILNNNKYSSLINNYISPKNNNINSQNNMNSKTNIILNQNNKNNNINTISTNLTGSNIISINNSNNNNIIITNKLPEESIPNEIKISIQNNNLEQYLLYMEEHKSYVPEFFLLLSDKKYNDEKSSNTLLHFVKALLNSDKFSIDLNPCVNLIVKQLINLLSLHKNNNEIIELIKKIISEMPIYLNPEKSLSSISKFLNMDNDCNIIETLLLSLENYIINLKNKKKSNSNNDNVPFVNLLDYFITEVFDLLKHQNSEIRKRAVYCCVEIHLLIGKEFEPFLNKIPSAQQNLIKLFIKKRMG